ncbi:MAG: ribonuclease P protein component [Acidobacteria bacterium]|nr:ribonuclease P protein component [Acidobacteriota bacterium]
MDAQRLKATEHIRRRPEFERVYATGLRLSGRFMTVFLLPTGLQVARLGVAATRKLGGAVERNRAKRLAREVFRRDKPATGYDVVIVPRREMLNAPFSNLQADFLNILKRRPASGARPESGRPGVGRPASASRV